MHGGTSRRPRLVGPCTVLARGDQPLRSTGASCLDSRAVRDSALTQTRPSPHSCEAQPSDEAQHSRSRGRALSPARRSPLSCKAQPSLTRQAAPTCANNNNETSSKVALAPLRCSLSAAAVFRRLRRSFGSGEFQLLEQTWRVRNLRIANSFARVGAHQQLELATPGCVGRRRPTPGRSRRDGGGRNGA